MQKVLLLCTKFCSYPLFLRLREEGYDVYTCGNKKNDFLAQTFKQKWINIDYSNLEQVKDLYESSKRPLIVPGTSDLSYLTSIKLIGSDDQIRLAETLHDKEKLKICLQSLGINTPKLFNKEKPRLTKVVVKPVDSFNSAGVSIVSVSCQYTIKKAIKKAIANSKSSNCIIEEFVEGKQISVGCFIQDNKIRDLVTVREHSIVRKLNVDLSYPIGLTPKLKNYLIESIFKITNHFNVKSAFFHFQLILKGDKLYFIEGQQRCPGDLYPLLFEGSQTDYIGLYLKQFVKGINIRNKDFDKDLFNIRFSLVGDAKNPMPANQIQSKHKRYSVFTNPFSKASNGYFTYAIVIGQFEHRQTQTIKL